MYIVQQKKTTMTMPYEGLKIQGGESSDPRSFEGVDFAWLYSKQNIGVWGTPPAPPPSLRSNGP